MIGSGVLLSGMPALAQARPSKKQDVAILNYALTLEYLESAFYVEAVRKGAISGDVLESAKIVRDHELAHVKALKSVLGKKAVKKPMFDFKNTTGDQKTFLADRRGARGHGRVGVRRPGPAHLAEGRGGRRAVDPLGGGAPRRALPLAGGDDVRPHRVRQGPLDEAGPEDREGHGLPRLEAWVPFVLGRPVAPQRVQGGAEPDR